MTDSAEIDVKVMLADLVTRGFSDQIAEASAELVLSASVVPGESLVVVSLERFQRLVRALHERYR